MLLASVVRNENIYTPGEIAVDLKKPSAIDLQTLKYVDDGGNFDVRGCIDDGVAPVDCAQLSTHHIRILIAESQARQDASGDRIGEEARKLLEVLND